jgi:hypothetical protein
MNDNEKPKTGQESPEQEKADWEDARLAWSEEQEKRPAVVRLTSSRRVECCGAFWDSKSLDKCPLCDTALNSRQNKELSHP